MTSIQTLVDAQKEMDKAVRCLFIELPEPVAIDVKRIWDNLTQALADYHKSHLEPEVQSPDLASVATLRSSSTNSIEQEMKWNNEGIKEAVEFVNWLDVYMNDPPIGELLTNEQLYKIWKAEAK